MSTIWIAVIPENNPSFTKEVLLKKLPKSLWARANRYLKEPDALSFIIGRTLLKIALIENQLPLTLLEEIQFSDYGKPYLLDHNFSISHSNGYVSLFFGTNFSVGIDIEKKQDVDLNLFRYLFTENEWVSIQEDKEPLEKFYWYWVRKEALLKAAGCSMKHLKQLDVQEEYGYYANKEYYFTPFEFDAAYDGVIATEELVDFTVAFVDTEKLLTI